MSEANCSERASEEANEVNTYVTIHDKEGYGMKYLERNTYPLVGYYSEDKGYTVEYIPANVDFRVDSTGKLQLMEYDALVTHAGHKVPAIYKGKVQDPRTTEEFDLFLLLFSRDDGTHWMMPHLVWPFEVAGIEWVNKEDKG
jgi:hypothetical protein